MQVNFQYYRRIIRRSLESRFGGYVSEFKINLKYPFSAKYESSSKFYIFTHQRSGSTLLVDLLNSHPNIICEGELILDKMLAPLAYINKRQSLSNAEVFGFKLQPHHFTYQDIINSAEFLQNLADQNYKTIILKRRNIFRSALSLLYAINSGKFHRMSQTGSSQSTKIHIDPGGLLENIAWIKQNVDTIDQFVADHPHLELIYEDDLVDAEYHQKTVDRVCDYLGVPRADVGTSFVRIMPGDFSTFVSNADEIVQSISKTEYAPYLNENI